MTIIGKSGAVFRSVKQALFLIWHSSPQLTLLNCGITLLLGIVPVLWVVLVKLLVDAIRQVGSNPDDFSAGLVYAILAAAAIIFVLNAVLQSAGNVIKAYHSEKTADAILDRVHAQCGSLPYPLYENPLYQDTFHRVAQDSPHRPQRILEGLIGVLQNSVALILLAGLFVMLHWAAALIICVAAVPAMILKIVHSRGVYELQRRQTQNQRKAFYYHQLLTTRSHAKEMRMMRLSGFLRNRFRRLRKSLRDEEYAFNKKLMRYELATHSLAAVAVFSTLAYAVALTLQGQLTVGTLVMYVLAFQRGLQFISSLTHSVGGLYEDSLFLGFLHEFLEMKPEDGAPALRRTLPSRLPADIDFKAVVFSYPYSKRAALKNIDLHIPAGAFVTILGPSGAGKSTLIKLLCRLYDPDQGCIAVGATDLQSTDPVDWRSQLAVIFQDFSVYDLTAGENIWFGDVSRKSNAQEIRKSADLAQIDEKLASLPSGYDTVLGTRFENGEQLSSGEWQRLALARSFFRKSPYVLLDEPTSALDVEAENRLLDKLHSMAPEKTIVVVSHRFSAAYYADLVVFMEDGQISETGTHDELMRHNGRYARFYRRQAKRDAYLS